MTKPISIIMNTDSYKFSHYLGYPEGTTHVYSYAESRGGRYTKTVFFGLQKFLRDLSDIRVTADDVYQAETFAKAHGVPFNFDGWMRIAFIHGGKIPVIIKAVKEGSIIPTHNVLVTVENTDPTMPWLTSYIETALLRAVWYPTTVATRVHGMKQRLLPIFNATSDAPNLDFAVLDFSARGCSSLETAEIGGLAYLTSFMGSDNVPAVIAAKKYYDEPMAGFSVPATEHSVMTSFGRENELESFKYLVERMMPENGILSIVSDTWNVYEAVKRFAQLQHMIENKNGTLVIRPDSGNMNEVLPVVMRDIRDLFWTTTNKKGFHVPNRVKILQGDGINEHSVVRPFEIGREIGISSDAIMTGSGGGLMQADIDRDTCKFAFKASNVTINGIDQSIAKDPITDSGKRSKMGRLALINTAGHYDTVDPNTFKTKEDQLQVVYKNGTLYNQQTLIQIRERLNKNVNKVS